MKAIRSLAAAALWLLLLGPAPAKTLVICSDGDPEALDPQLVTTLTGIAATDPVFEGLVGFAADGSVRPALAETWTVSPDARSYTFHLRKGVRFQSNAAFAPTRDFDADDVIFSFDRQSLDSHPYHGVGGRPFTFFEDLGFGDIVQGVDRIDDNTVRFRLKRPNAPFLADLAMPFADVLSAEYGAAMLARGTPDRFETAPIGTGPYSLDGFQAGTAIRYRVFPTYWGEKPKIDTLVMSITPSPSVRLNKLRAGECQVMFFASPADVEAIGRDPRLVLLRQAALNVGYMTMNASQPPFDDVRVRRAVNMAVDREVLIRAVFRGFAVAAKNPLPPSMWAYDDAVVPYPLDVAAARRLMVEAGHADGFDADLWYMPVARPYSPDGKRMAEMVADDLARIGIRARLRTLPWSEYVGRLLAGVPGMAFIGETSDNGDPDDILGALLACRDGAPFTSNIAKWCDSRYDDLVRRAAATQDRERRAALYREAQAIVHDQAPWVPIAHSLSFTVIRSEVRGFAQNPFGRLELRDLDVDRPDP